MNNYPLTTPVVFITFNRPDVTKRIFDRIRAAPQQLFTIANAPRVDRLGYDSPLY